MYACVCVYELYHELILENTVKEFEEVAGKY